MVNGFGQPFVGSYRMTDEMTYRDFTVTGRVYSGNNNHAEWVLYWAIRNSEHDENIIIHSVEINQPKKKRREKQNA